MNRRIFTGGLVAVAATAGGEPRNGLADPTARRAEDCGKPSTGGITEADFHRYIAAFNRGDFDAFGRLYAPDVEFEGQGGTFHGRDAVLAFYREVRSRLRETIRVRSITQDESGLVADLVTQLEVRIDWPDFPTGALRAGETRRSENFVWYEARAGALTHVRSAHYQSGTDIEPLSARPRAASCGPTMSAEKFRSYIDAFNQDDYAAFGDYYDPDVELVIAGRKALRGRQAIFDFYREVKAQTHRVIEVDKLIRAPDRLAAELHSEFVAREDSPHFIAGAMKRGERIFIRTFVLYELREGRFARIRSAEFRKLARS